MIDVRRLLAVASSAHPGWDWAVTMNPETLAQLDIPVQSVESTNPQTGARYTVPGLWGSELLVLQLVHEVVLCSPVGTPERRTISCTRSVISRHCLRALVRTVKITHRWW